MKKSSITIDKDYTIGEIDKNIFGSFVEHMGRAVYEGIYEPTHNTANSDGFRQDVLGLVREIGVPVTRYPGGNFVSSYKWTDGIGPKDKRPRRVELAWHTIESNQVGIDDFVTWAKQAKTDVMAAVNLGTGTPEEAGNMLEYCNFDKGTYWSDMRIANGHETPHNIKTWCLGNEMDGPWQIGQLTAEEYGKKAREAAKIMRIIDPSIELVACGSSSSGMPTYPEWDRVVLEHCYNYVDYISLHHYFENYGNDKDFLGSFATMDAFIHTITSVCDYVKAKNRSKKTMMLSFDEWNVWYERRPRKYSWQPPNALIEDNYSMLDALVFSGLLCTLVNNCDRVKMACLAQLVNIIAPILTQKDGAAIRQTIFYPYKMFAQAARGVALRTIVKCDTFEYKNGTAPEVHTSTVHDQDSGTICIFAVNNNLKEDYELALDIRNFDTKGKSLVQTILSSNDISATNTFANPSAVVPSVTKHDGVPAAVVLPKASFCQLNISFC